APARPPGGAAARSRPAPPVPGRQAGPGATRPTSPDTLMTSDRRDLIALVGALLVAAACVRLGIWQLDRLHQRRAHNALVAAAPAPPELHLRAGPPPPIHPLARRPRRPRGAYGY